MDQIDVSPEEKINELPRVEMVIFKIREKSVSTDQR